MLGGAIENKQAGASIARLLRVVEALGAGTIAEPLFLTKRWDVGREFVQQLRQPATPRPTPSSSPR